MAERAAPVHSDAELAARAVSRPPRAAPRLTPPPAPGFAERASLVDLRGALHLMRQKELTVAAARRDYLAAVRRGADGPVDAARDRLDAAIALHDEATDAYHLELLHQLTRLREHA